MDIRDYQKAAMRTSPDGHDRMLNGCMGLIGESGEVVDIVKKWKFQSGDHAQLPKDKMIDELGDVLWYCAELCTGMKEDMLSMCKMWCADKLEYDGRLHIEALFLARLAQSVVDAWLYPDEYTPTIQYTVSYIVDLVSYLLERYCDSSLQECMEHNIEKLLKRYPDGFDPERSLHRTE